MFRNNLYGGKVDFTSWKKNKKKKRSKFPVANWNEMHGRRSGIRYNCPDWNNLPVNELIRAIRIIE